MKIKDKCTGDRSIKCLVIVYSYHHKNTLKIADAFSKILSAKVIIPDQVMIEEIEEYDLIGFGAGIDSGRHYKPILDLVDLLPLTNKKPAFIFSTSGVQGEKKVHKDHSEMRQRLLTKGYTIIGEFSCKGFNTNVFLKYFGGMNKGKPDENDLKHAEEFASNLLQLEYSFRNEGTIK